MSEEISPEVKAIFKNYVDRAKAKYGDNWKEKKAQELINKYDIKLKKK